MRRIFLSVVPALIVTSAHAQWKSSGSISSQAQSFEFPTRRNVPAQKAGLVPELRLDGKFQNDWRIKSELWARTDFVSPDHQEFFQWNAKNLYLQKKTAGLVWRLGYQTLALEGPDLVNPTDVIHSKNYVDPTAPVTLGSAGLSLSQELEHWRWDVFYVPFQTRPVLPGPHSAWLPRSRRLPIESANTEIRVPSDVTYQYRTPEELNSALKHNYSLRVGRKSEKLEFQGVYYNGLAHTPFLVTDSNASIVASSPTTILQVNGTVGLKPIYYRQQVVAGSFTLPFESWAIRGGGNWMGPIGNDSRIPRETSMGVLGLEKSIQTAWGMITAIVEKVYQRRLNQNQISFLRSINQDAWAAGLRIPMGEETTFSVGGIYDQKGGSSVYKSGLSRRLSDSWSAELAAQFIQGPKQTLLGLYDRYDSYQGKLTYAW